jgi:predicted dehydrogenase
VGSTHGVGIIGLGVISRQYLDTLVGSDRLDVVAVADLDAARAADVAGRIEGAAARTVDDLLADDAVDTVLNLTIPAAHADIALRAIAAGKHVYGEKPLALNLDEAHDVMTAAAAAGVRVSSAPDTVLGTGVQTARSLVDAGAIGRPVAASATWVSAGHERWHPAPDFYYLPGGGPLFDMGPYYLTSLVQLLGPVAAVTGSASRTRALRTIATGPRAGEQVPVEVDTHVTGILEHVDGAVSTIVTSFDGAGSAAPPIEIHGEAGSLRVPDPNFFDGDVLRRAAGSPDWEQVDVAAGYADAGRGVGLLDAAAGGDRASGDMGLHVLEIMAGVLRSAREHTRVTVSSRPPRPSLVPLTGRGEWGGAPR